MSDTTRKDVRDAIIDALSWRETLHPDKNVPPVFFYTTTRSDLHDKFYLVANETTFCITVEKTNN